MTKKIYSTKLKRGDSVRIIAPSDSLGTKDQSEIDLAIKRLEELGLTVTFGKHVKEVDLLESSSIQSRIEDLHDAFKDSTVKAIICAKGGFNANQLLKYIDWEIIKNNPKIFCGYSDITALNAAIYAKTGLVTYSTPTFSSFSKETYESYTKESFQSCLFSESSYEILPAEKSTDWTNVNEKGEMVWESNEGIWIINSGETGGTIIGENLCTLNLLQGTEYFPDLTDTIICIEDTYESDAENFTRDLQSLIHQPKFNRVKGIVIGKFQKQSGITKDVLIFILSTFQELKNLPILANVDFGHITPRASLPIGGEAQIKASSQSQIIITTH